MLTTKAQPQLSAARDMETAGKRKSEHFQSLQIFTNYAEPPLDEYVTRKEQIELENKQKDEEEKLYRSDQKGTMIFFV